ncbi:FtsX-like permease family protein [Winogradskyella maritima]|nr:FtsX-like permease family protein [Winogradskyella maritima]
MPSQSINYSFLDQEFSHMHDDVERMGKIFNSFALFAILVACLGLFALSAFMVEQRKKEISIRLVLGAPFKSIYKLLTVDFMKLIIISIAIAIPVGWYLMSRWLEDFAYHITIGWGIFFIAGFIALTIAILTISYQSIGAALIQPLKSLRKE